MLGGVRIEHQPEFWVIVSVVPGVESRVQAIIDESPIHGITSMEMVERTEDELSEEQVRINAELNALGIRFSSGVFGQEIRVFVEDAE